MVDFSISSIEQVNSIPKTGKTDAVQKAPEEFSFGQWLSRSIHEVNNLQKTADASALKLVTGESKDIHGTMIQMQKAEIATSLMVEVRNKVIAAYEEIKRMQF